MLPQNKRVKKEMIPKILRNGSFLSGEHFTIQYLDRQDQRSTRFSLVVSGKVDKTSVGRHRIKRKMTAVVESILNTVKPGLSVLIFAKKTAAELPYQGIQKEIVGLLSKL
jgi:ribonuclease P protein component